MNSDILYRTLRQTNREAQEHQVKKIISWLITQVSQTTDVVFIYDFGHAISNYLVNLIHSQYSLLGLHTQHGRYIKKSYVEKIMSDPATTEDSSITQIVDGYNQGLYDYKVLVSRLSSIINDNEAFETIQNSQLVIDISNVIGM